MRSSVAIAWLLLAWASPSKGVERHHESLSNYSRQTAAKPAYFRPLHVFLSNEQLYNIKHGSGEMSGNATQDRSGMWHGQVGQDQTIMKLTRGKRNGYFVDLAANEPVFLSNTRALERDYGWNGTCIDGNAHLIGRLARGRSCRIINAIISDKDGATVQFARPKDDGDVNLGGFAGVVHHNAKEGGPFEVVRESAVTLHSILDFVRAPRQIDYLSLDVEGAEFAIMKNFDFERYRFNYATIERPPAELRSLLRMKGYLYIVDHGCFGDQLWAHRSLAAEAANILGVKLKGSDRITCREDSLQLDSEGKTAFAPCRRSRDACIKGLITHK